jgi:uncharacterized membrane protein
MPLQIADYGRVTGLAAITGMRHLSGLALVGYAASRCRLENLEGTRLWWLGSRKVSNLLLVAALGELVVDKLPFLPGRNTWPMITQQAAMGALVGSALGLSARRSVGALATLGALTGAISSWSAYYLRTGASRELGVPDLVVGLAEDALVVGGGLALLVNMGSNSTEAGGRDLLARSLHMGSGPQ